MPRAEHGTTGLGAREQWFWELQDATKTPLNPPPLVILLFPLTEWKHWGGGKWRFRQPVIVRARTGTSREEVNRAGAEERGCKTPGTMYISGAEKLVLSEPVLIYLSLNLAKVGWNHNGEAKSLLPRLDRMPEPVATTYLVYRDLEFGVGLTLEPQKCHLMALPGVQENLLLGHEVAKTKERQRGKDRFLKGNSTPKDEGAHLLQQLSTEQVRARKGGLFQRRKCFTALKAANICTGNIFWSIFFFYIFYF